MRKAANAGLLVLGFVVAMTACQSVVLAQGVMLRGIGAVNESMGSAATACPLDAAGAIHYNPASISAFQKSEMSIGLGLILPDTKVTSSVDTRPLMGPLGSENAGEYTSKGDAGAVPVPTMALVWKRCPRSRLTYGLGLGAVGGAAALYPSTGSAALNPILGGRSKSSTVIVMQVTPTVSYQVTDKLSIGVAPIIDLASLSINPMQLGQPLGAANEIHNYGTRYAWGGGFQMGAYYDFKNHFKTGFMFKSPIWAESLTYDGTTLAGNSAVSGQFDLNLPMTLSWGVSYDGFRNTVLAMDVRYFDYGNTTGFKTGVVDNRVNGLDWDSVFAVAFGVERTLTQKLKVRAGYCWNQNPIPSRSAALNVAAPMMIEHTLSFGATYAIVKDFELHATYTHAFTADVSGTFPAALTNPYTGKSVPTVGKVTSECSANIFMAGITKKW